MKTKATIDLLAIKREEMQSLFSDHVDFSQKGYLATVHPELSAKEKKVSAKELYTEALSNLRKLTSLESAEEIITRLEDEELDPANREFLRLVKLFH